MVGRKACLVSLVLVPLAVSGQERPVESKHHAGPGGLESWTLSYHLPQDDGGELAPATLVVRHGRVLRRIEGDPFVWAWRFQANGTRVALESRPLHFSLTCRLIEIATGKEIERYDCFHELPADAPTWVKLLEADDANVFHD